MVDKSKLKVESEEISVSNPTIRALFILALTAEKLPPQDLKPVVHIADEMLKKKDPVFAKLMEELMQPQTRIEVANIQYAGPFMHTPQTMQSTLAGWIKKQYNVDFKPQVGKNFFPHGMRDAQGRENYFLFYFDIEE